MRRSLLTPIIAVVVLLVLGTTAHAGFKLKDADGNEKIDLGFRLQFLGIYTDRDLDGDGNFESFQDFRIRRARFRLKGTVTEHFGMFLQTDVSGNDIQMIDAYIHLKKDASLQGFLGQHLAPSNRQNITSSGTLMAADRPNVIYKTLTWGVRALNAFATATVGDTDLGIRGTAQVRDTGVTVFGHTDLGSKSHLKYYVGYYDGISSPGTDKQRGTIRLQFNMGDPEPSYYSTATYLGKKDTFSIGVSYDTQPDAGRVQPSGDIFKADYTYYSIDLFAEKPLGAGSLTFEAAYSDLDLQKLAPRVEGNGYYVQLGYLINKDKWQPWIMWESWDSEATDSRGGFRGARVGVSYFLKGHNANIKVGYENLKADVNIGSSNEDTLNTFLVGFYTTY